MFGVCVCVCVCVCECACPHVWRCYKAHIAAHMSVSIRPQAFAAAESGPIRTLHFALVVDYVFVLLGADVYKCNILSRPDLDALSNGSVKDLYQLNANKLIANKLMQLMTRIRLRVACMRCLVLTSLLFL